MHILSSLPCNARKLEKSEKIKQITEGCHTPLRSDFGKSKRNHKEGQNETQPIKIIVRILEISSPLPENKHSS